MAAESGPRFLFCMTNRTKCIPLVPVMFYGPRRNVSSSSGYSVVCRQSVRSGMGVLRFCSSMKLCRAPQDEGAQTRTPTSRWSPRGWRQSLMGSRASASRAVAKHPHSVVYALPLANTSRRSRWTTSTTTWASMPRRRRPPRRMTGKENRTSGSY
jgi:hypothetical protein